MVKEIITYLSIPWIAPPEGIIISMYFCISLFEERKPRLIGVSTLREIKCSRSRLVHHLIPLLLVLNCAMASDNGSSRSFVVIFKVLGFQIEVVIYNGVDPIRVTVEDKTINT